MYKYTKSENKNAKTAVKIGYSHFMRVLLTPNTSAEKKDVTIIIRPLVLIYSNTSPTNVSYLPHNKMAVNIENETPTLNQKLIFDSLAICLSPTTSKYSQNIQTLFHYYSFVVLAPHGCGAISVIPDFMSYNARRLGDVADGVRRSLSYHKVSCGAEVFRFPRRPPFR